MGNGGIFRKNTYPLLVLLVLVLVLVLSSCTREDKRSMNAYDDALLNSMDRAKELTLRQNLKLMRDAVQVFFTRESRYPTNLDELATHGVLDHIPAEPFGKGYDYDPSTGTIKSRARPSF